MNRTVPEPAVTPADLKALSRNVRLRDGREVCLKPIRAEDAEIEQAFVRGLSARSRYLRFHDALRELSAAELKRLTDIDYRSMMAIIAVTVENGVEQQIGVARYAADTEADKACEFAIVISDAWCGTGLATVMMEHLISIARARGFVLMYGDVLQENTRMLKFAARLGFRLEPHPDDATLRRIVLDLAPH